MDYKKLKLIEWDFENVTYGNDMHQNLDLKLPNRNTAHAIIYIHGGAFFTGNKQEYPSFLNDYTENHIIASIDYRLVHENNNVDMEDILTDINDALKKITELAILKSVAIKDFILIGHSAGGQISLLYGYKFKEKIRAIVSLAGPADFTDDIGWSSMSMWGEDIESRLLFLSTMGSKLTGYPIKLTQHDYTKQNDYNEFKKYITNISPITYAIQQDKVPPTLIVHAKNDNQVPYSNAVRLNSALDKACIPHKLITPVGIADSHMLGGVLYYENTPFYFDRLSWLDEAKVWINQYLL